LKPFYIFKISKINKSLHAGWAAVGRKPGQAEGSLLAAACARLTRWPLLRQHQKRI